MRNGPIHLCLCLLCVDHQVFFLLDIHFFNDLSGNLQTCVVAHHVYIYCFPFCWTWWKMQQETCTSWNGYSWIPCRLRHLVATYGATFIVVSVIMSVTSFLLSLLVVSVGVDVKGFLEQLGNWLETTTFGKPSFFDKLSPQLGSVAMAYLVHRLTSPLRFPLCVAVTRYIGKLRTRRQLLDTI